jgi:YfiH family protein
MIIYDSDLKIFSSSLINDSKYFSGFATRELGDGKHDIENIFHFLDSNDIEYRRLVIPEQIHSVNIESFSSKSNEKLVKIEETDGVITREKGTVLTVVTADCCPIIFAEKKEGIIGISHHGWRGSVKKFAVKIIDRMIDEGARKENINIAIGPAIGECCYDVDNDRYYEFREEFDGFTNKIFHHRGGRWHLNLAMLNYLLLLEVGIKKENIDFFPFCTKCDKDRFFSFRRDRKTIHSEMFSFITRL